ncbi:HAMP domain-containing sensor histidine kinase [Nonomuraea sp. NPDC049504]|uniref:sensor histidine kinase n=1 Tax=Nonomuraea sp. NPDC049504 TaxID=3154729 RepID=UPI003416013E
MRHDHAALLAAVPNPCLVMAGDMTIVAANQPCLDACGREQDELMGMPVRIPRADELHERANAVRRFTADASHEVRTPLAALRVQVEAARRHPDDIDVTDLLDHVSDDLDRLENVTTDLLLLSRLEAGLDDRELTDVNLTALVESASAGVGDVRLRLDPTVLTRASSTYLTRLLAILLGATRHPATVTLDRTADYAELRLTSDDPSETSDEPVGDQGGTGLCLAIARAITTAHHGSLHVETHGAHVTLRLPLRAGPRTHPST